MWMSLVSFPFLIRTCFAAAEGSYWLIDRMADWLSARLCGSRCCSRNVEACPVTAYALCLCAAHFRVWCCRVSVDGIRLDDWRRRMCAKFLSKRVCVCLSIYMQRFMTCTCCALGFFPCGVYVCKTSWNYTFSCFLLPPLLSSSWFWKCVFLRGGRGWQSPTDNILWRRAARDMEVSSTGRK